MEIPSNLKNLYRHWSSHVGPTESILSFEKISANKELFARIVSFIEERMNIWKRKTFGEKLPYTKDSTLARFRFCNIFREFDRQTIEFHRILNHLRGNFPLWLLNMFYFRMVARAETVKYTGLLSFNPEDNKALFKKLSSYPRPRFGNAYVFPISAILKSETPSRELFISQHLPRVMMSIAKEITTWRKKSVREGVKTILPIFEYNLRFLWTEVLIDTAYQFPRYIDLFKQFPVGPGALPTMKKIDSKKDPAILASELSRISLNTGLTVNKKSLNLSAENWEGIACEFRKYENLKSGKGRKRLFSETKKVENV